MTLDELRDYPDGQTGQCCWCGDRSSRTVVTVTIDDDGTETRTLCPDCENHLERE